MNKQWSISSLSPSPQWLLDLFSTFFDPCPANAEILGFRGRLELDNGKHPRYGSMLAVFHPTLQMIRTGMESKT